MQRKHVYGYSKTRITTTVECMKQVNSQITKQRNDAISRESNATWEGQRYIQFQDKPHRIGQLINIQMPSSEWNKTCWQNYGVAACCTIFKRQNILISNNMVFMNLINVHVLHQPRLDLRKSRKIRTSKTSMTDTISQRYAYISL